MKMFMSIIIKLRTQCYAQQLTSKQNYTKHCITDDANYVLVMLRAVQPGSNHYARVEAGGRCHGYKNRHHQRNGTHRLECNALQRLLKVIRDHVYSTVHTSSY